MTSPAPLLETRGLTMRFGGVVAGNAVDFTLADGELRCLIGPNGAGKSTFFKMLTGQLLPSAGTIVRIAWGATTRRISTAGVMPSACPAITWPRSTPTTWPKLPARPASTPETASSKTAAADASTPSAAATMTMRTCRRRP